MESGRGVGLPYMPKSIKTGLDCQGIVAQLRNTVRAPCVIFRLSHMRGIVGRR